MATTYTPLLGLAKHATTDPFDVTLLNDNANTLDTALGKAYRGKAAHNLLDNSDFSNLVNQRGFASGAQIGPYNTFLDRWYHGADNTVTLTINSQGIIFKSILVQKMTQKMLPNGTTVTAAAKYTDGTLTLVSGTVNMQDGWHWFACQAVDGCTIGVVDGVGTSGNPYVRIENENGKTLSWAALYEGSYTADTLPEYVPKGYAAELAECQRYYYQTWDGAKPTSGAVLPGLETKAAISGVRLAMVKFPVTMRIAPSITLYTSYFVSGGVRNWNTSSDEVTGVTAVYQGTKGFMPSKSSNSFTAGQIYSFHYSASADI